MKTAERKPLEREETLLHLISHHVRVVSVEEGRGVSAGRACRCCECAEDNDYVRMPGLFRRWELEHLVDTEADFNVEPAGCTADGTELFAVYRRERPATTTHRQTEE
ncbi:hypothetical protein MFUL124B02_08680 [Myxococcus fulvus 124B02]|nr:hypothetical protein MFUL124B02_08680 [Myxococcus fulvus 124B02]